MHIIVSGHYNKLMKWLHLHARLSVRTSQCEHIPVWARPSVNKSQCGGGLFYTNHLGVPPTVIRIRSAILLCRFHLSMATATIRPPKNRKLESYGQRRGMTCAIGYTCILFIYIYIYIYIVYSCVCIIYRICLHVIL